MCTQKDSSLYTYGHSLAHDNFFFINFQTILKLSKKQIIKWSLILF